MDEREGQLQSHPFRFEWLDALRGLAAVAVVVFHYKHFYFGQTEVAFESHSAIEHTDSFPHAHYLWWLYEYGDRAVQLFWILSGFVFAHVYVPRRTTLKGFVVARVARLYPLHLLTLALVAIIQVISLQCAGHWQVYGNNDLRHFVLQLLLASDSTTLSRGLSFNGPIWSVSLEIVAYAIFFLLLPTIKRWGLMAAISVGTAFWTVYAMCDSPLVLLRMSAVACAAYFFLGTTLYLLLQKLAWRPAGVTSIAIACLSIGGLGIVVDSESMILASMGTLTVATIATFDRRAAPQVPGLMKSLGSSSYAIYLIHVPLQLTTLVIADCIFSSDRSYASSPLLLPVYVVFVVSIAHVINRKFEIPTAHWIRKRLLTRESSV